MIRSGFKNSINDLTSLFEKFSLGVKRRSVLRVLSQCSRQFNGVTRSGDQVEICFRNFSVTDRFCQRVQTARPQAIEVLLSSLPFFEVVGLLRETWRRCTEANQCQGHHDETKQSR